MLCLKDSNGKTRESAYQLLLVMAEVRNDITDFYQVSERSERALRAYRREYEPLLTPSHFLRSAQIVVAAYGATTPHMRSAAVQALSRVVFEVSERSERALRKTRIRATTKLTLFSIFDSLASPLIH